MRRTRSLGGASSEPASPCTGRGLASRPCRHGRWWALTPPFHPYRPSVPEAAGGLLSVPLSVGFRRLGFPSVLALRCPDFPRAARAEPAVTRPALPMVAPFSAFLGPRRGSTGIRGMRRSDLRTNSPHTRHSRLAPRMSAVSSWSSVRLIGETSCEAPEHACHPAEYLHVLGVERLERAVLRLEPNAAADRGGTS